MSAIIVEEQKIRKGNFSFISEVTGDVNLEKCFWEMEKKYYTDPKTFAHKLRYALEAFAKSEYQRLHPEDGDDLKNKMSARMQQEKNSNNCAANLNGEVKIFLILRCCLEDKRSYFKTALRKWKEKEEYSIWDIRKVILELYAFGSESSHPDFLSVPKLPPTEENCRMYIEILYYLIRGYCRIYYPDATEYDKLRFNEAVLPLEEYIPLTAAMTKALRLKEVSGKKYYIRERDHSVNYYLGLDLDAQEKNREIDVLRKVWADDNDHDPNNIIRFSEHFSLYQGKQKLLFALPSKSMRLTNRILKEMKVADKEKIYLDAIHAVESLHRNQPPIYHRGITPEAFALCKTKNSYKLFLCNFDCAKDTDANANYTVVDRVAENADKKKMQAYLAPEILEKMKSEIERRTIDWEKSDVYSLGILGVYIFTGDTNPAALESMTEVSGDIRSRIRSWCLDYANRPSLLKKDPHKSMEEPMKESVKETIEKPIEESVEEPKEIYEEFELSEDDISSLSPNHLHSEESDEAYADIPVLTPTIPEPRKRALENPKVQEKLKAQEKPKGRENPKGQEKPKVQERPKGQESSIAGQSRYRDKDKKRIPLAWGMGVFGLLCGIVAMVFIGLMFGTKTLPSVTRWQNYVAIGLNFVLTIHMFKNRAKKDGYVFYLAFLYDFFDNGIFGSLLRLAVVIFNIYCTFVGGFQWLFFVITISVLLSSYGLQLMTLLASVILLVVKMIVGNSFVLTIPGTWYWFILLALIIGVKYIMQFLSSGTPLDGLRIGNRKFYVLGFVFILVGVLAWILIRFDVAWVGWIHQLHCMHIGFVCMLAAFVDDLLSYYL